MASEEWGGGAWEQQAVLDATADDTVRTSVYDQVRGASFPEGIADRVLRNAFTAAWEGRTDDVAARRADLRREAVTVPLRRDGLSLFHVEVWSVEGPLAPADWTMSIEQL